MNLTMDQQDFNEVLPKVTNRTTMKGLRMLFVSFVRSSKRRENERIFFGKV